MRSIPFALLFAAGLAASCAPPEEAPEDSIGVARQALTTSCTNLALPSWPTSWQTMMCHGTPSTDPVADVSPSIIDAVGSASFPAVQSAMDANFLYLRMRTNLPVGTSGCTCTSCSNDHIDDAHGWGYDFDTDGNPSTYEFQLLMNGASNASNRTLEFNANLVQAGAVNSPSEKAETQRCQYAGTDADARVRVDKVGDGSSFGGDCDFFISMAFPLSELSKYGINMKAARLVWAGSSAQAQNLSGDLVCDNGSASLKTSSGDPTPMCLGGCCTQDSDCAAGPSTPSTLAADLTSGATTASVASTTGYPSAGLIVIESEYLQYTGITATSFTGLSRGALGTTASAHTSGKAVVPFVGETHCNATAGLCECTTSPDSCPTGQFCDPVMKKCRANCTSAAPQGGACSTTGDMTLCCDDGNSCTTNACTGGKCVFAPTGNGSICDDNNACSGSGVTETATCSNGTCGSLAVACADDGLGCTADICQPTDLACVHTLRPSGYVCRSASGDCDIAETCDGSATSCPADTQKPDGTSCSDGSACTSGETCTAGVCGTPTSTITCTASDQCHQAGLCNPATGLCSNPNQPDGTPCSDGTACTSGETCTAGACGTPSSSVICTASDQCHQAGLCDPSNGTCSNPASPDGTPCDDGDLCTTGETCATGGCAAGTPVVCNTPGACEIAIGAACDPGTGACLYASILGTACVGGACGGCATAVCDRSGGGAGVCEPALTCGNGVLEAGEGCDDGGTGAGDGCSATCLIEDGRACNADVAGATGDASCANGLCDTTGGGAGTCEPAGSCGNGKLEPGEGCDDGGTAPGDGCDGACKVESGFACNANVAGVIGDASCESGACNTSGGAPGVCVIAGVCGNGVLEPGEGCDDGGLAPGDGCGATCKIEDSFPCSANVAGSTGSASCESGLCDVSAGAPGTCEPTNACGNGKLEPGEGCDDGGTTPGDGCTATCTIESGFDCGADAAGVTGSASCESGVCDATAGAPGTCEPADTCGNGKLEPGEGCDDGGTTPGDGCDTGCKIEISFACNTSIAGVTGDASCQSGACDTSGGAPGVCISTAVCGDGVVELGEGCDDGGTANGDGCSGACLVESGAACNRGAGAIGNASCESGVCNTTADAPGVCAPADTCGNGKREAGEGCDDGGTANGDGCDAACKIENGLACNGAQPGATGNGSCASGFCDTSAGGVGVCRVGAACGNGVLESGEGCDDGGTTNGDGCSGKCLVENGGMCNTDTAGATGSASCQSGLCDGGVCRLPSRCGDGVLDPGEGCDDGATASGDGCSATCLLENGAACNVVLGGSGCASGVCNTIGGAIGVCVAANTCGNGVLERGEACDDGNRTEGDGCGASCLLETAALAGGGFSCAAAPGRVPTTEPVAVAALLALLFVLRRSGSASRSRCIARSSSRADGHGRAA